MMGVRGSYKGLGVRGGLGMGWEFESIRGSFVRIGVFDIGTGG